MIETRLLRQFIAVAEELHFHKAAIRLHMAQPPLSQAINRLEGKLGFSLFTRSKRGVKLTPAGGVFLDAAYSTLNELERGIEHARQVAEGIAGKLTVTAVSITYYASLLSSLRRFRETFPKVQLVIKEMPSASQAKAIVSGEADIAFMRKLPIAAQNVESRLLLNEQIVMALPADHSKADAGQIDLRDFAGEDFVFTPQALGSGYHSQLIALCEAAGFLPQGGAGSRAAPYLDRPGGLWLRRCPGAGVDCQLDHARQGRVSPDRPGRRRPQSGHRPVPELEHRQPITVARQFYLPARLRRHRCASDHRLVAAKSIGQRLYSISHGAVAAGSVVICLAPDSVTLHLLRLAHQHVPQSSAGAALIALMMTIKPSALFNYPH